MFNVLLGLLRCATNMCWALDLKNLCAVGLVKMCHEHVLSYLLLNLNIFMLGRRLEGGM